jgi:ribonuclease HI
MPEFTCVTCDAPFTLSDEVLDRYPGWTPRFCKEHGRKGKGAGQRKPLEENLRLAEVLERYSGGPQDGIFTDGSCSPNPGPGGWGAVWVRGGEVLARAHGREADTTNNRMELRALIEGMKMLSADDEVTLHSDSQLCVKTINEWAAGWERRGWTRKTGAIKNLDLVQELYASAGEHPKVRLEWLKAHSGNLWNEYADSLATAWMRDSL